jgi:hypothetical protein
VLALCVTGTIATQVQADTVITFSVDMSVEAANNRFDPTTNTVAVGGTFNNFAMTNLVRQGTTFIYTNTLDDTTDANGGQMQYEFWDSNAEGLWENLPTGQNRAVILPTTNGASLVLPTPVFNDAGAPVTNVVGFQVDVSEQILLGNFTPGVSYVEVRGLFNDWGQDGTVILTNNPNLSVTNLYGVVTSNVWTGAGNIISSPAAAEEFEYVIQPDTIFETPNTTNADGGGTRFFINVPQTLPLVSFSDQPYAPVCAVTFSVDMSLVAITDTNFNPSSVAMVDNIDGWITPISMTNNPSANNTNIYTAVAPVVAPVNTTIQYQFLYTESSNAAVIVYDHYQGVNGGTNYWQFLVPDLDSTNVPAVMFNDASLSDYLSQPTAVFFSVDMNGAVGTDSHQFNPANDAVYVNGQFSGPYPWAGGASSAPAPGSLPGTGNAAGPYLMVRQGASTIYTNTIIFPVGTPVFFSYNYGMDPGEANGGPLQDEAAASQTHMRVIRSTALNPYVLPTDKFGVTYHEPLFSAINPAGGQLTVGAVSGGRVPVSWLGRPGLELQTAGSLAGSWQTLSATDGTNWVSGYSSINGFVSQTNYPVSGTQFFRLVEP